MRNFILFFLLILPTTLIFSQKKLRDSVLIKTDLFNVVYSEVLEQPLYVEYKVLCSSGKASRKGLDFYTSDSIKTSDSKDYENNMWDKGHMAPAADFNCTKEMIKKTFTYLNCVLQQQDLNRTTWRLLEEYERSLSSNFSVEVSIRCVFNKSSIKLSTGATVPVAFYKSIKYGNKKEVYYFKNEKPLTTDFKKFIVKG